MLLDSRIPGVYTLLAHLDWPALVVVGKLGPWTFDPGFYCYVGSALGGLRQRLVRHLRQEKTMRWHIDYLLQVAQVSAAVYAPTLGPLECQVAAALKAAAMPEVPRFGCSDCHCSSHLFFGKSRSEVLRQVLEAFCATGLAPELMDHADLPGAELSGTSSCGRFAVPLRRAAARHK